MLALHELFLPHADAVLPGHGPDGTEKLLGREEGEERHGVQKL